MSKDLFGRSYATVADTHAGAQVEADGDFTCIKKGAVLTVEDDGQGELFVPCRCGRHYLDGQYSDDQTHYVGLYNAK